VATFDHTNPRSASIQCIALRFPTSTLDILIDPRKSRGVLSCDCRTTFCSCTYVDIKPYISVYDSHPDAAYPEWIESTALTAREVRIHAEARSQLEALHTHLRFYENVEQYISMIEQLLPLDIRSVRQGILVSC
jgi:hypothetical protein